MRRVVITGSGIISSLGNSVAETSQRIEVGECGVKYMAEWEKYCGLQSLVAAPATVINVKKIPRVNRRSMGNISIMAVQAAEEAIAQANISKEEISSQRIGCIVGSTMGGAEALSTTFESMFPDLDISQIGAMQFFKCVSHTAAMNLAQYFKLKGSVLATSSACASASQAIGAGYDLIRIGRQDVMLCGGSEEVHPTVTGSFDILYATSTHYNSTPKTASRPFEKDRDGLVCGEGAGILVLEEYEHARARGANVLAEIVGYDTRSSGAHISNSSAPTMVDSITEALAQAGISPSDVDYVNAHATATTHGDEEEIKAIKEVFGDSTLVSSLKGQLGHTLGASGAIELALCLKMMDQGLIYPTYNLDTVSPECEGVKHVKELQKKSVNVIVKNCFAFGGINAVIVLKKYLNGEPNGQY